MINPFRRKNHFGPGLLVRSASDGSGAYSQRVHLRVDEDDTAVLWVNANESFYLNPTASIFAWCCMKGLNPRETRLELMLCFGKDFKKAYKDYQQFAPVMQKLIDGSIGACDICALGIDKTMPFSKMPSAPYRMDLALTYGCNNRCAHCYNEKERYKGLDRGLDFWKKVLDKVAEIGIPHVLFTGGEPTLLPYLPELIAYAERLGLVSGLNTNGRKLADPEYVKQLERAGLDHLQITLESADAAIHDRMVGKDGAWQETIAGARNAAASRIFTMTNTTLLRDNASEDTVRALFEFLNTLGIRTIGLNALIYSGLGAEVGSGLDESELPPLLEMAKQIAREQGQKLIWYTPTQYCRLDPLELGFGIKACTAARYSMCVEPDGSVLPCQSWYQPVGNLLSDDWQTIWHAPLCEEIRGGKLRPAACAGCESADVCRGGCPLANTVKTNIKARGGVPECF